VVDLELLKNKLPSKIQDANKSTKYKFAQAKTHFDGVKKEGEDNVQQGSLAVPGLDT